MKSVNSYRNSTIFLIAAGLSLLLLGLFLIVFPFDDYSSNMNLMSIALAAAGALYVIAFSVNKKLQLSQGFYLIIMGILVLYSYDREFSDSMNLLFAMWALSSASAQLAACVQLRSLEYVNWWRMMLAGISNIIFFAYFVIDPLSDYISTYTSFGIYILVSGIICLSEPFIYRITLD